MSSRADADGRPNWTDTTPDRVTSKNEPDTCCSPTSRSAIERDLRQLELLTLNANDPATYRPLGRVASGMPISSEIDAVLLDGEKIVNCFEADDVAGYVKCYTHEHPLASTFEYPWERRFGVVRFISKPQLASRQALRGIGL